MSITPSHIIQYLYCPRFIYFEYVLGIPQYEEKNHKVIMGRNLHDQRLEQNKNYLRKRIGAIAKLQDQYLTNSLLRGVVDEVITLKDGTMAPLDYKFAEYKERLFTTYQTQLFCYAWLISENFGVPVNRGYLVYTRSNNKIIEIPIKESDIHKVSNDAANIIKIIDDNFFPKATNQKLKCLNCTYRNICVK